MKEGDCYRLYVLQLRNCVFGEYSLSPEDRVTAVIHPDVEKRLRAMFGVLQGKPPFIGPLEIVEINPPSSDKNTRDTKDTMETSDVCVMTWARYICQNLNPTSLRIAECSRYRLYWELRRRHVADYL